MKLVYLFSRLCLKIKISCFCGHELYKIYYLLGEETNCKNKTKSHRSLGVIMKGTNVATNIFGNKLCKLQRNVYIIYFKYLEETNKILNIVH